MRNLTDNQLVKVQKELAGVKSARDKLQNQRDALDKQFKDSQQKVIY